MNDDRLDAALGSFYRDTAPTPPDPDQGLGEVMTRVARTRQRGRWWPLPTFERPRLPAFPSRELAPASIPATNGHSPARGFTMFSALKFAAASVIVALFGGFLLAGVLTTQQGDEVLPAAVSASPTIEATSDPTEAETTSVRTDILSGVELTVEEVEPGVFRVLHDGVRTGFGYDTDGNDIVAGHDGSILLLEQGEETPRRHGSFYRLGSDESLTVPTYGYASLAVTPDGTVWASGARNERSLIHSLTDGKWTRRLRASTLDGARHPDLTVAPDGTAWVAIEQDDGKRLVIRRLGTDGWQRVARPTLGDDMERLPYGDLVVSEGGDIWWVPPLLGHEVLFDDEGPRYVRGEDRLLRLSQWDDGSEWVEVTADALVYALGNSAVEIGSDGAVWYAGVEPRVDGGTTTWDAGLGGGGTIAAPGDSFLMRYDGAEWQRWGPDDNVPSLAWSWNPRLEEAPDGGLWVVAPDTWVRPDDTEDLPFDGIARFDGSTWRYFLAGHDVGDWDVAPDGSVWLRADGALYVITPEAVATAE